MQVPYGLSLASYLRAAGIDFRIFGKPMANWQNHMPNGMLLKSDGCASDLYAPQEAFTLRRYCEQHAIPYKDRGLPVTLATFVAYGLAFTERFVPDLDRREIVRVDRRPGGGFLVHPSDGEPIVTDRVVMAVGISHFQYMPPILAGLSPERASHTSGHNDLSGFRDRDVLVIGAGASALDTAALLHRNGCRVQLVSRRKTIAFLQPPVPEPSLIGRLRNPPTGIGPGWRNVFCTQMPLIFHLLPEDFRREVVRRHLGPAPGWFSREHTEGRLPFVLGATPVGACAQEGRVQLQVAMADGTSRKLEADHIIAGTGYKVDLHRIPFLSDELVARIDAVAQTPRLSSHFECSVRGLYFTGLAAANSFGPVMRFAVGAKFATPRLARHLVRTAKRRPGHADQGHRAPTSA